jgi:hypothetical protein
MTRVPTRQADPTSGMRKLMAMGGSTPATTVRSDVRVTRSPEPVSTGDATSRGGSEYNFLRRNISARRKAFRLAEGAEPRTKSLPGLVWTTSRKVHNRLMHALNGNTAARADTTAAQRTSEQLATIAVNREAALARRLQLQTVAANRAAAVARKEAKRARAESGLQPPDLWRSTDWRPPLVPATPKDFLNDPVPEDLGPDEPFRSDATSNLSGATQNVCISARCTVSIRDRCRGAYMLRNAPYLPIP